MTSKVPAPPQGSGLAGARVWRAVLRKFDLDEHELVLLVQAVRVIDVCETLHAVVDAEWPMVCSSNGAPRAHPAVVELRMQRLTLARLFATLRVPLGEEYEEAGRLQRRGAARGSYGLRGSA